MSMFFNGDDPGPERPQSARTIPAAAPPPNDPVERPAHYTSGKIEVADFIEDQKLGWHLGNAVKYIARAGKKDPTKEIEDLKKARWYVDRCIKRRSEAQAEQVPF